MSTIISKKPQKTGVWHDIFVPSYSERIRKAKERLHRTPEICLERARAEMKAYNQYKNEPRIIQRARVFETYLREKTIFISEDELLVGNITSKILGAQVSGEIMSHFIDKELDDPVKDFESRPYDRHIIHPEERKELREILLPYFKGKTHGDYSIERMDAEVKEKAYPATSSCPHIPNMGDISMERDVGHQIANHEKVLRKGLQGIKEEVQWYQAQLSQPYAHFDIQKKHDFYEAVLITIDAAMAYAKRYSDLAAKMAAKEENIARKQELQYIAAVCSQVPSNPARDWWEALQSVWMIHLLVCCELSGGVHCFGRFDQYIYPYYKETVMDNKSMSRDQALELLEFFWLKINEPTDLRPYEQAVYTTGRPMSQTLVLGGQTSEGADACNEVTMLCLEAEEQLNLIQPETAMRIWEGTPDNYLKKAAELVRLGRGKPKFFGDRKGIQMVSEAYTDMSIKDWRDYAVLGCTETVLPHITMGNLYEGVSSLPKLLELTLNNGNCVLCGRQIGPLTGDPRTFTSMNSVRQALLSQMDYWMQYLVRGIKQLKECQADRLLAPFCSSLAEGPLQQGIDIVQGGAWHNHYGLFLAGVADVADSLAVIDKLIYRDKNITWEQLLEALKANWEGHENLRQLCINGAPKYGNDDDYADDWAAWVMDAWYDCIDRINMNREFIPRWGGKYVGATNIAVINVMLGEMVGALPNGHIYPKPQAETLSPVQGMDKNGPTAVIKSVSKLPTGRFALGGAINLRLSPQLMATDRDLDNFVSFLRTCEELGLYHIQFNVVSSEMLRKAMKEPEKYQELIVRVASYCTYFVELTQAQQMDIINRTEQHRW